MISGKTTTPAEQDDRSAPRPGGSGRPPSRSARTMAVKRCIAFNSLFASRLAGRRAFRWLSPAQLFDRAACTARRRGRCFAVLGQFGQLAHDPPFRRLRPFPRQAWPPGAVRKRSAAPELCRSVKRLIRFSAQISGHRLPEVAPEVSARSVAPFAPPPGSSSPGSASAYRSGPCPRRHPGGSSLKKLLHGFARQERRGNPDRVRAWPAIPSTFPSLELCRRNK